MNPEASFVPLTGACRCRAVRFRMETAPIITHCCHCRLCQASTGSAFNVVAMIETDRLAILEGEPQPFHGKNSQKALQCPACRCSLWAHHPDLGEALAFVGLGMLDHGERLTPEAHYFTRSRHPWVLLPPDVPAFEELGDPGKAEVGARIAAALGARGAAASIEAWTKGISTT